MALESATYVNGLVITNPDPFDTKSQGDDHMRLIKRVLKNTFPNITGPITVSQERLNALGANNILCFPGMIVMWSGTIASIPAGWKLCNGVGNISNGTAVPNLTGRFVVHADADSGGTYNRGAKGGSATHSHSVTVAGHTLSIDEIPAHTHTLNVQKFSDYSYAGLGGEGNGGAIGAPWRSNPVQPTGGGGSHSHGASASTGNNIPPFYALAYIIKD